MAKDMGMSSEALVHILKSLSVEVKSHMSSVSDDIKQRQLEELHVERQQRSVLELTERP